MSCLRRQAATSPDRRRRPGVVRDSGPPTRREAAWTPTHRSRPSGAAAEYLNEFWHLDAVHKFRVGHQRIRVWRTGPKFFNAADLDCPYRFWQIRHDWAFALLPCRASAMTDSVEVQKGGDCAGRGDFAASRRLAQAQHQPLLGRRAIDEITATQMLRARPIRGLADAVGVEWPRS